MSDVFISYARATADQAQRIAEALQALGCGVWRDDDLPAHRDYSEVIEERLRAAKAVVVVWSAEAVKSQWVRAEADLAREAGTLVQLTLDGAPLPMPFNRIQCADLCGWRGDTAAAAWKKVAESVVELLGGPAPTRDAGPPRASSTPPTTPDRFPIALAPFADPAGGACGDDFADGLVAEIATALARFPILLVGDANRASAARYRLEGSVRRFGPRVRINVQLRDAAWGERVWAEGFDGTLDDPFAFQDDVAIIVASRVEAAILAHETRRIASRPVENLSAHELWLRARETIRRGGLEQVDEIEALSERALALEPGHAFSHALLACALGFRIAYAGAGADVAALGARLQKTIDRAMVAGADDPEVLTFVAEALLLAEKDMVLARALVERALKMNPGLVLAWDISANILMQAGEYEEALARYERFLHLDPKSPWRTWVLPSMGGCLVAMGRFDEAIVLAKEGLQIAPNNPWGAADLIAALAHSGRIDEAREVLAQFDPRQARVFRSSQFGPKLSRLIDEALKLAGWTGWAQS
ncbi:MAG TPA: TIR domain-containing protein [Caulobacteraceae bacterium]